MFCDYPAIATINSDYIRVIVVYSEDFAILPVIRSTYQRANNSTDENKVRVYTKSNTNNSSNTIPINAHNHIPHTMKPLTFTFSAIVNIILIFAIVYLLVFIIIFSL